MVRPSKLILTLATPLALALVSLPACDIPEPEETAEEAPATSPDTARMEETTGELAVEDAGAPAEEQPLGLADGGRAPEADAGEATPTPDAGSAPTGVSGAGTTSGTGTPGTAGTAGVPRTQANTGTPAPPRDAGAVADAGTPPPTPAPTPAPAEEAGANNAGTPPAPAKAEPAAPAAAAGAGADPALAAAGQQVWDKRCKSCHGADGSRTKMGSMVMQDLTDAGWQKTVTDAQLTQVIREGRGKMPGYAGKLSDQEIRAVVAHLRSL